MSATTATIPTFRGFLNARNMDWKTAKADLALKAQMYFKDTTRPYASTQNAAVYKIDNTSLVCFDADDKESNDYVASIMEKHGMHGNRTPSVSNYFKHDEGENAHKFHYWFKTDKKIEKKIGLNGSKLDVLSKEIVFEPIIEDQINPIPNAPILTDAIYADILKIGSGAHHSIIQPVATPISPNMSSTAPSTAPSTATNEDEEFIDENTTEKEATSYDAWRKVIFKIANKYGKTATGLQMALYFSAKDPSKYNKQAVENFWENLQVEKVQHCIFGLSEFEMQLRKKELSELGKQMIAKAFEEDRVAKEQLRLQKLQDAEAAAVAKKTEKAATKAAKKAEEEALRTEKEQKKAAAKEAAKAAEKAAAEAECAEKKRINHELALETKDKYITMKTEFEKTHCKIIHQGVYIESTRDGNFIRKQHQMQEKYLHMSYRQDIYGNNVPFIFEWLKDPEIRAFNNMEVYPNAALCPKDCFNMWRPFEMELVTKWTKDEEGLAFIINHIRIICGNDDLPFNQVIKWFAHMIQHPEHKSFMPQFISEPGAGKTTIYELLEKMFGAEKCLSSNTPGIDVWGPFNSLMAGKFIVCIDDPEIVDQNFHDQMKGIILGKTLRIQKKGVDSYIEKTIIRLMTATNNPNGIMREAVGERRTLTIRSSDEKIGDFEYFTKLRSYIDNVDSIKTFYEYLKTLPEVPEIYQLPEKTEYQLQLTSISEKPIIRWLKEMTKIAIVDREEMVARIANGNPANEEIPEGDHVNELSSNEAHSMYNDFCKSNNMKHGGSVAQFGVSLFTLGYKDAIETKKTKTCNKKVFNISKLTKIFEAKGW